MSPRRHSKPWEKSTLSKRWSMTINGRRCLCRFDSIDMNQFSRLESSRAKALRCKHSIRNVINPFLDRDDAHRSHLEFEKLVLASSLCEKIANNSKVKELWLENYLTTELSDESTIVCMNHPTKIEVQMGRLLLPTNDKDQSLVDTVWLSDVVGECYHFLVIEGQCTQELDEIERRI